jgi:two-component system phosphate regulon response regulator PhoB
MPDASGHPTEERPSFDRTLTVLLVEDDKPTRDMYSLSLLAAGYRVRAVADGIDALRSLEGDGLPDAVVLDLLLPRLSGFEVCRDLRARPETRHLPVVIVSGADVRDLNPAEFRYVLRKPIRPETLLFAVETSLRRSKRLRTGPQDRPPKHRAQ